MNNTQLYPFERNRYYPRKRMSSGDFTAEQVYMNNKRRFLNGLMYGSGIVCGLGVFSLDDLSLLVESGVAIDGMGREIVVDISDIKKLSAISGFDSLRTNRAALCLRYQEEDVHKVYAIDQDDPNAEFRYNRVREGYSLFLMDSEDIPEDFEMESEFLVSGTLLSDSNFLVKFSMPAMVSRGHLVKTVLSVTKLSDEDVALTYFGTLQMPAFVSAKGENAIRVDIKDLVLETDETVNFEYWMETLPLPVDSTNVILESGSSQAYESDMAVEVPSNLTIEIILTDAKPREVVNRVTGRINLEMRNIGAQGDFIRLADLVLVRTENAYLIEEVIENGIKSYVTTPAQEMLRGDFLEYFVKEAGFADDSPGRGYTEELPDSVDIRNIPEIATGTLEIPLGEDVHKETCITPVRSCMAWARAMSMWTSVTNISRRTARLAPMPRARSTAIRTFSQRSSAAWFRRRRRYAS